MPVFVTTPLTSSDAVWLRQSCNEEVILESDQGDREANFRRCDVLLGRVPEDWAQSSSKLRWIQLGSAGFDDLLRWDWRKLTQRIQVTNLAGFFSEPVAQTAFAGLLTVMRGIDQLARLQPTATWDKMSVRPRLKLLQKANVLLAGYGSIARRFEEMLQPFGCAVTRFSRSNPLQDESGALSQADVVLNSLPDTAQTRCWFDARRISVLKPSAIFINVGRGGTVSEDAMIQWLQKSPTAAAVLDVTTQEPLPQEHPFWRMSNVLLTQHTGGGSGDENRAVARYFLANLARFRRGEQLQGLVDFHRGY